MKKFLTIVIILLLAVIITVFTISKKDKEDNNLTQITLAEVAHTIFYAPQYLAINNGYFEEEGLKINLILTSGADAVMSAVLSGDADIGFSGTEATIYVYNGGEKDYIKTFAGLTQKDGSFLVSRKKYDNFTLEDLKGKTIIGGRIGGMPEMTFEWALRQNNIDPKKDVNIDTSIAFSAMEGAFIGGTGDFVTLFEPNALSVEKNGYGYVVAYIGELGGNVPYTAYNARTSYIENNKDIIKKFTKAINKGLEFVKNNSEEKIAECIIDFFPDTSMNDLIKIVKRYKDGNAWKENITINEEEFKHIQDIMKASNELDNYVEYDKLIFNEFFKDYE
ncbi:MAG: ABC transporter substrate-binding protein [Bacilli bacterium]|nr:ABC transporter substrate-binding protein [Bacilli bacterium]